MVDPKLIDSLTSALKGVLERELRTITQVDELGAESDIFYTHVFPKSTVSLEPLFSLIFRIIDAEEEHPHEGAHWQFHFAVNGQHCRLRWAKAGIKLDLYSPIANDENREQTAESVEQLFTKAAKQVYRRVIAARVKDKIKTNDVVLVNQYRRYRGMVDFYINEIRRGRAPFHRSYSTPAPAECETINPAVQFAEDSLALLKTTEDQAYRAIALVAGYFSWAQHLLIMLTAFSPKALAADFSLDQALKATWADQFDLAYPKPHDKITSQLKSDLSSLARDYRNPLLHGGGGRYEDGLMVEWAPGHKIISLDPDSMTDSYMLWQPVLDEDQVDDLLARIERIDEGLAAHPFFAWVESGLPADFRTVSVNQALDAVMTGRVKEYTSKSSHEFDDEVNWDF